MSAHQAQALFLGLAAILVLARVAGAAARRIGQLPVIGEILAGVVVGPTVLHGAVSRALFPADIRPLLAALANVGLALFMFLLGVEFERAAIRDSGRAVVGVTAGSVLLPFGLCVLIAAQLAHRHAEPGETAGFVLFLAVAMTVTAVPVLGRILTDRDLLRSRVGRLAPSSAAATDVIAWSLVAAALTFAAAGGGRARCCFRRIWGCCSRYGRCCGRPVPHTAVSSA